MIPTKRVFFLARAHRGHDRVVAKGVDSDRPEAGQGPKLALARFEEKLQQPF